RRRSPSRRSNRRSRRGSPSSPPGWRAPAASHTDSALHPTRLRGAGDRELTPRWRTFSILAAHLREMEDSMTLTHDRRAELLAGCQLFKGIDAAGLSGLAA